MGDCQTHREKAYYLPLTGQEMISLSKDICLKFKEARQAKGLNQSALAQQVGCKQSAISMFESGMVTKLSEETVRRIAEFLGVSLEEESKASSNAVSDIPFQVAVHGYCPNCECPSNIPYVVNGRLYYKADRKTASPAGGKRCTQCGEILETCCPSCGAPLNDGACCAACGNAYVTPVVPEGIDMETFARNRRIEIAQIRSF